MKLIDKSSPIPVYHQVASNLLARITSGEWEIGQKLPSESALIDEYGVSRVTLRQSLSNLEQRGLIQRKQGQGAFLCKNPAPFVEHLNLPTLNYDLNAKRNESKILEWTLLPGPTPYLQQFFEHIVDTPMVYLRRLFLNNGKILGLNQCWFPESRVPGLLQDGLIRGSVSYTLQYRYHHKIARISNYMEAVKTNAADSALLGIPYDSAAIQVLSTHYTSQADAVEYSSTLWVGALTRFLFDVTEGDSIKQA